MCQRAVWLFVLLQASCFVIHVATTSIYTAYNPFSVRRLLRRTVPTEQERCVHTYCTSSALRLTPDQYHRCLTITCAAQTISNVLGNVSPIPRDNNYKLIALPLSTRSNSIRSVSSLPFFRSSLFEPTAICPASSLTGEQLLKYCTRTGCYVISSHQLHSNAAALADGKSKDIEKLLNAVVRGDGEADKTEVPDGTACVRSRCADTRKLESCIESFYCCFADADSPLQLSQQLNGDDHQQFLPLTEQDIDDDDDAITQPITQPMTPRTRRVNDDVSQCIQSYCSGKQFPERLRCIVKNCHRTGAAV